MKSKTVLVTISFIVAVLAGAHSPLSSSGAEKARTTIKGTLKSKDGKPLPGLVLLEKGGFHNNKWYRGTLVDKSGQFTIELGEGDHYGVHAYSSGYLYLPLEVRVETGKTVDASAILVPEPSRASDPNIKQVMISDPDRGKTLVKMEVTDPNNDLGPQVLAFDAGTGRPYAMNPPKPVRDLRANFPNGVYQIEIESKQPVDPKKLYFVVADHQCNTTDILGFPHKPERPVVIGTK